MRSRVRRMSYRTLKIFLITLITAVLVHYSVAWAMLECFHGKGDMEAAVSIADPYYAVTAANHLKTNIECIGSEYRIEPLASESAANEPSSITGSISSRVNGLPGLQGVMETATANLWLFAVFEQLSTPIHSPRYLSLSVLRI